VAGYQNGGTGLGKLAESGPEGVLAGRVEAVERFVEKEDAGRAEKRRSKGESLSHALRILIDVAIGVARQLDKSEQLVDAVMALAQRVCCDP
jgi:hypothetical protein